MVFTSSWCDWPGCKEEATANGADAWKGQATKNIQTWFYPPGKGHKPRVISNDLCEKHFEDLLTVRDRLKANGELVPVELVVNGNGE